MIEKVRLADGVKIELESRSFRGLKGELEFGSLLIYRRDPP